MLGPSQGEVLINSKNIKDSSKEIMNDMGLCTQENMLFPDLSVQEQLQFFAKVWTQSIKLNILFVRKMFTPLPHDLIRLYQDLPVY